MQCSGAPWEALGGLRDAILRNPLEQSLEYLQTSSTLAGHANVTLEQHPECMEGGKQYRKNSDVM